MPISSVVGTQLKILKVDGVYPSAENVNSGKYKHIVPFGIVYKGELKGLAKTFVDFLYDDKAQKIITSVGTVPATGQVKVTTSGYYQGL